MTTWGPTGGGTHQRPAGRAYLAPGPPGAGTTFHTLVPDRRQQAVNEMPDGAAGQPGPGEDPRRVVAALADLALGLHDERQAAIDRARDLDVALTELGVLAEAA